MNLLIFDNPYEFLKKNFDILKDERIVTNFWYV